MKPRPTRLAGGFLLVDFAAVFQEATVLDFEGIEVGPVDQATQIVPLVHATKLNPVAQSHRYTFCEIDVVRDQHCLAVPHIEDEALMPGTLMIIGYQAPHDPIALYPGAGIILA